MIGQKVKVYHPTKKDEFGQKKIVEINSRTVDKAIRDMGYIRVDVPEKPPVNTKQAALDTIARIQMESAAKVTTQIETDIPSEPIATTSKPKTAKK